MASVLGHPATAVCLALTGPAPGTALRCFLTPFVMDKLRKLSYFPAIVVKVVNVLVEGFVEIKKVKKEVLRTNFVSGW